MRRRAWSVLRSERVPAKVVMLKKTVPTSWTAAAHQSMPWGANPSSARSPVGPVASGSMPVGALTGLVVLQRAGTGEEQRADEERDGDRRRGDVVEVERQGAQREADRADGEEPTHPAARRGRATTAARQEPTCGSRLDQAQSEMLAVPARRPFELAPVGPEETGPGDEPPGPGHLEHAPACGEVQERQLAADIGLGATVQSAAHGVSPGSRRWS